MFVEDRPILRVHGDSSMFIGRDPGHAVAVAAPVGHGGCGRALGVSRRPWGRLQRNSYFLAVTTFDRASDAHQAIGRVRAIHERVTGTAPGGRPYAASDPRVLTWVHIAEADSFLRAHSSYGARPSTSPNAASPRRCRKAPKP